MGKKFDSITKLKGIGDKSKLYYEKLGIVSVFDLLNYFPRTYEINKGLTKLDEASLEEKLFFRVRVEKVGRLVRVKRLNFFTVIVSDDSGEMKVVFYNQPYLARSLQVGKILNLRGKLVKKKGEIVMISPNILSDDDMKILLDKPLIPVYKLTRKLSNKKLREKISLAFDYLDGEIKDFLPQSLKATYKLMDYLKAIKTVHFPMDFESLDEARKRLIFDEFLLFSLSLLRLKKNNEKELNSFRIVDNNVSKRFIRNLPFELTNSQKKVIFEIEDDLYSNYSMNRLVQGDVGSGKTLIATVAILDVVTCGYQAVFMAPTEVLAKQHFESLSVFFEEYNIRMALLTSSVKNKEKIAIKEALVKGEIDLIVATHAVLTEDTVFDNLALIITDEQHRFGVRQRETLVNKGDMPHVIVMSATPIPRTLALILYSDMDLSVNDDMPSGRIPIKTYHVNTSYRKRIYSFMQKEIDKGNQCYVVCAKATQDAESELVDVDTYREIMEPYFAENVVIKSLHGQMKNDEKNEIMTDFVEGRTHILVSTTVIEVGIDVKDATCIVIENAERFGLSQLHQLRGRVGRSDKESFCILISDSENDETKQRLDIMSETNDGFEIASKDLKLRGHGDLLGCRQSGIPTFRLANIYDDVEILKMAKNIANILIYDEEIDKIEYNLLREHRVISGSMRGIKLNSPENDKIRPTLDRYKEDVFNIINANIIGASFLDIFAGTGSIGIEAISRGASDVCFIENDRDSINILESNLKKTKIIENNTILKYDYSRAINLLENQQFDFIYLDPPFNKDLEMEVLNKIARANILKDDGLIICESSSKTYFEGLEDLGLEIKREKKYKYCKFTFLKRKL